MHSEAVVEEALRLCGAGLSARAVARELGIPDRTVRMWRSGARPKRQWPSRSSPPPVLEDLPPAAYAYLLGLYLGDGWIATMPRGTCSLRISLDQRYPQIITAAAAAMGEVNSGKSVRTWRRGTSDAIVASHWKRWPSVLPQHGTGPKHARPIVLADWQRRIVSRAPGSSSAA